MKRSHKLIIIAGIAFVVLTTGFTMWQLYNSNLRRGFDAQFGDQHLKTSVALIELHKVRYGRYPADLSELKFTGDWDPIALNAVSYRTNSTQTRYCVEVQRGWIAKPRLNMPPEFWQGTGYDPSLCE